MEHGTTKEFVVLLRISTSKSGGKQSNGIAAQRRDIDLFLKQHQNHRVIKEFVEVESGAKEQRPTLEQAVTLARKHKCPLVVSKVDRLTRCVETLGRLTKIKDLQLKIASLPNADNFQIHLYGILASQEREFISQRTIAGMHEARKKGKKFGNPKLAELNKTRKREAKHFAYKHADLVMNLRREHKTYREICDFLNRSGIKTRNGGIFHPVQVHRILKRAMSTGNQR